MRARGDDIVARTVASEVRAKPSSGRWWDRFCEIAHADQLAVDHVVLSLDDDIAVIDTQIDDILLQPAKIAAAGHRGAPDQARFRRRAVMQHCSAQHAQCRVQLVGREGGTDIFRNIDWDSHGATMACYVFLSMIAITRN